MIQCSTRVRKVIGYRDILILEYDFLLLWLAVCFLSSFFAALFGIGKLLTSNAKW